MDNTEDHAVKNIEKKAEQDIGQNGIYMVVGTYFIARTAITKSVGFGLPTLGLCNSIHVEVSQNVSLMRFEWKF